MTKTGFFTNESGKTRRSDRLTQHSHDHGKVKAIAPAVMQRA